MKWQDKQVVPLVISLPLAAGTLVVGTEIILHLDLSANLAFVKDASLPLSTRAKVVCLPSFSLRVNVLAIEDRRCQ